MKKEKGVPFASVIIKFILFQLLAGFDDQQTYFYDADNEPNQESSRY